MIVARYVVGAVWAITATVAGGWIAISPWALGLQQPGTGWSMPAWNLVAVGVGLAALGVISFATVHGILFGDLRAAGVLGSRPEDEPEERVEPLVPAPAASGAASSGGGPEDDALTQLAHLLAAELARSGEASPAGARG
jgi:hypothetical protein